MKGLFQKYDVHLPIPTLYVMGDRDYMFLDPITKMLENVKTAALLVVVECGHVVNIEQAKIFNEEVIKYLHRIISQYHNRSILH
ncbi:MAG: hypothetical protein IPO92_01680 [Saprospiraceae bacterium]|nr:hypothetical protein [Saprospiraceae bacterium]